jgi:DivIVA domain-containing protein
MVLLTVAVVAGVSAVVAGVVTGGLNDPTPSIPQRALPSGPLTGQDVADLRFVPALRGYRMDQVDAAMDTLAAEIERLRGLLPEGAAGSESSVAAAPWKLEQPEASPPRPTDLDRE